MGFYFYPAASELNDTKKNQELFLSQGNRCAVGKMIFNEASKNTVHSSCIFVILKLLHTWQLHLVTVNDTRAKNMNWTQNSNSLITLQANVRFPENLIAHALHRF